MRVVGSRRAPSRSSHAATSPSRSSHLTMAETPLAESRMPLRIAAYVAAMSVVFPSTLAISAGRAVYQRVAKGTPDAILPTGRINPIAQGGGYAGQMYFAKPLDQARLQSALDSMADDAGIPREQARVDMATNVDGSAPRGSHEGTMDFAALVDGPGGPGKGWFSGWDNERDVSLRCNNGAEGELSVVQFSLPGGAGWLVVLQLHEGDDPPLLRRRALIRSSTPTSSLSPASAEALRGGFGSFALYLARLPLNVLRNCHSISGRGSAPCQTSSAARPALRGRPQPHTRRERAARQGTQGARREPVRRPRLLGRRRLQDDPRQEPARSLQQASLVTAAYEPYIQERNVVGDFLVGPLQRVGGDDEYTLAKSQAAYETLRTELAECSGAVRRSFEAKAYGVLNGGAAAFEAPPTFGDDLMLLDSVFFNNYGTRTVHEDAQCVGWNWGAPFKLGVNCIFVNGRTCICFASSVLSTEDLAAIRDHAQGRLLEFTSDD